MNSALVMGMFIKQSLARQTAKVQDHRDFMVLNSSEREYFMLGIAAYMAKNKLPNQITKQQLDEAVRLLLKVIPDSASTVDTMSGEKSTPLNQRLPKDDDEKALEYVKTDVRSCGLLVSDLNKLGAFKFAHKSFMEYLFASLVHNRLVKDKLSEKEAELTESVWNAIHFLRIDVLYFPVSVYYLAEMLEKTIYKLTPCSDEKYILAKNIFDILILSGFETNNITLLRAMAYFSVYLKALAHFISITQQSYSFTDKVLDKLVFGREVRGDIFELWYQCCKALKIEDEEIAKVVGKWAMPAFKKTEQD
jgi:hypothetical protein